jgi:hypothetical protein
VAHRVDTEIRSEPTIVSGAARSVASPAPPHVAAGALPSLKEIGVIMVAAFSITALLVCGLVSFAYERFYQALGINPADVGLGFGVALSRSAGFIVALAVVVALVTVAARLVLIRPLRRLGAHPGRAWTLHSKDASIVLGCYVTLGLLALFLAASVISPVTSYTAKARSAAASGNPVRPLQLYGLPLLATQAEPAFLQPANKARTLPGIWDLHDRSVLYLGQSGGISVLYDSDRGNIVYAPMSLVVLHVGNCAAGASPSSCRPRSPA